MEVSRQIRAYEVYVKSNHMVRPERYFHQFYTIHAAPPEHWRELAEHMVDEGWTVYAELSHVDQPERYFHRLESGNFSGLEKKIHSPYRYFRRERFGAASCWIASRAKRAHAAPTVASAKP
jgi:hypothetical protein